MGFSHMTWNPAFRKSREIGKCQLFDDFAGNGGAVLSGLPAGPAFGQDVSVGIFAAQGFRVVFEYVVVFFCDEAQRHAVGAGGAQGGVVWVGVLAAHNAGSGDTEYPARSRNCL